MIMSKANPTFDLVSHSEEMLDNARQGKWDKVARAESLRRQLLNRLFATDGAAADIPEINKIISQVIAINRKLEQIALEAREEAGIDLRKVREGRLAVNSYVKHV